MCCGDGGGSNVCVCARACMPVCACEFVCGSRKRGGFIACTVRVGANRSSGGKSLAFTKHDKEKHTWCWICSRARLSSWSVASWRSRRRRSTRSDTDSSSALSSELSRSFCALERLVSRSSAGTISCTSQKERVQLCQRPLQGVVGQGGGFASARNKQRHKGGDTDASRVLHKTGEHHMMREWSTVRPRMRLMCNTQR